MEPEGISETLVTAHNHTAQQPKNRFDIITMKVSKFYLCARTLGCSEIAQSVQRRAKIWMTGVIPTGGKKTFSIPDRLWGPPRFLLIGTGGSFPKGQNGRGAKLRLVSKSRMVELYFHSPISFRGVMHN
jgi:hypothetical protein